MSAAGLDAGAAVRAEVTSRLLRNAQAALLNVLADPYSALLADSRSRILARLAAAPFADALQQHFHGGKMLRALSVFLSAASVRGDPALAINAAEAIELLHGASLVHDDIVDRADLRRGQPALHTRLGPDVALVLGDYLLVLAFETLAEAQAAHPAERVVHALTSLATEAAACCRGQIDDLDRSGAALTEDAYLAIAQRKTAAPFAAAMALGAIFGGGRPADIAALRCYGQHLGVAFQIRDDVLDLIGTPEQTGKPTGNSLMHARPSLPLIYLMQRGSSDARDVLRELMCDGCATARVVDLLQCEGIFEQLHATQARYVGLAQGALDGLAQSVHRDALRGLADYAGARHH